MKADKRKSLWIQDERLAILNVLNRNLVFFSPYWIQIIFLNSRFNFEKKRDEAVLGLNKTKHAHFCSFVFLEICESFG